MWQPAWLNTAPRHENEGTGQISMRKKKRDRKSGRTSTPRARHRMAPTKSLSSPLRILIDRRPTNMQIRDKRTGDYCADVVMTVDQASRYLFKVEAIRPDAGGDAIVSAAQETLRSIRRDNPDVQAVWVARQHSVARALAAAFDEDEISIQPGDTFSPWDEAYLGMDRHMGSGGGMLPYLWRGDITEAEVAELFEAAALFYRMQPWEFLTDADLMKRQSLQPDEPPLLVSVMGASGISRGIVLFDTEDDFEAMMDDKPPNNAVFASFEPPGEVPHFVTAEAEEHGWLVADASAFPMVVRVRKGKPIPCRGDDLRRVTAAFRAFGEMTSECRRSQGN